MKLKNSLLVIILLSLNFIGSAQESQELWTDDYNRALELAQKENKPILIFFTGSDWCGNCKRLVNAFIRTKKFTKMVEDHFILYEADFPRKSDLITLEERRINAELMSKFNERNGFPTISIINADEELLGSITGFTKSNDPKAHYELLNKIIRN